MGRYRGLITGALLGALALSACSKRQAEQQQRELLTPPDQAAIQREKRAKVAIVNEEGELLPSDLVLGGFPVPRGFEIKRSYDNEWYLRSLTVSAERAAKYTEKRVFTGSLVRSSVGGVRFEGSQLRDAPSLPKVNIRISPTKGRKDACELYIERLVPVKVDKKLDAEQIREQVRKAAEFAD
jgi:hypothetical protein